jgi:D-alanyl-D-alanine carboxypeptidase (penicillin-binding protein 5/6)
MITRRPVARADARVALTVVAVRIRALLAVVLCALSCAAPAALAPGAAAPVTVPPPAPSPTDSGSSPMAPDPHPPLGGLAPDGHVVGGARLRSRDVVSPAGAPPLPQSLTAAGWILVDLDSRDVLAARDPHGRYQPASILKLLTSVTLLPLLPGTRTVTVSTSAANTEGSHAGLVANGRYPVDELFSGLLLVSGNDTAAALAEAAGGVTRTVELMNREARQLGAYDTVVETPSGLDGWRQLTSAYDMALVLRAAVRQPRFVQYDRQPSAVLPWQSVNGYGPVTMQNQNLDFLTRVPGALVAKTGYTDAAAHTFAGAIERNGRRLGVVLLRAQRWPTDQWQQATDLMNWGFKLPAAVRPVGHLDGPIAAAAAVAAVGAGRHPAGAAKPSRNNPLAPGPVALGALAITAAAAVGTWARRRRATR